MNLDGINFFQPLKHLIGKSRVAVRDILNEHFENIIHDEKRRDMEMRFIFDKIKFITKKWIMEILWEFEIHDGLNFNEIVRHLTSEEKKISTRSLSDRLKQLLKFGLISRTIQDTRPPTVHYKLTDKGKGFIELSILIILQLFDF